MGIQVLGPLVVDGSGRLGPRDRAVLQALTVRQGGSVAADELTDAVWGDHPPASAHKNLQSCVVRLRKALGADAIETTSEGYRLGIPAEDIDSRHFETQVARGRELLELGEADRVVYILEEALRLWRGQPFPDLPEWPLARREAGRLEELRRDAEELLLDAQLRRGRAREVLPRAHEMVRTAPLRERRWELLALAQYRTGAQGEALRSIRQLRAVLARELGIDPSPEMAALEQSILTQDPSLRHDTEAPPPSTSCPWQGLQAYDVAESDRFFGREAEIEAGLEILAGQRMLALVGPSGSGKSSLMRAGIGARLQQRGTRCATISPGRYPTRALGHVQPLHTGDALLVDQAEELFTLCEDPDEARAFLDLLVAEAAARPVVVALRADRMADLPTYPAFSRLVERGLYLVGGLDEAGLRSAVEGPARQAGLLLEPGLVDLLVTEVRDDPGALPLLSHALLETWKRREGSTLTVDGYRASGGIHGAVAQSAELLYAQVDPGQRETLRALVLRLLSPGSEGEPVRTRVPRRLVGSDPEHAQLIEMLVAARLVTSDDGVLEITHESLARAWPRLRGWLEDDVDGRRILHHLSSTADAWETLGRPPSELYRGVRLTRALDWWTSTGATLTPVERDFLDAARTEAEVEERSAAERVQAQARLIRRLRIVLGGAVFLLVLALAAGGVAAVQSDRANDSAAEARASAETAHRAAVAADARRIGSRAQLTNDISLSLLLAVAGVRLYESPETRVNLLDAQDRRSALIRSVPAGGSHAASVIASPDGRWIASSDIRGQLYLYDASNGRMRRKYDASRGGATLLSGVFGPDSRSLAVTIEAPAASREPIRLLDPLTMQPIVRLAFPDLGSLWASDVHFSRDGRYLAATMVALRLVRGSTSLTPSFGLIWDLRSPSAPPVRVPTGVDLESLALSPDGRTLYAGGSLTAYDVESGEALWTRPDLEVWQLEINAAGTVLALADGVRSKDVLLVDASTGATITRLRGDAARIIDLQLSPDGTLLGSLYLDGELVVWDPTTGRRLHELDTLHAYGFAFSPDNRLVHSGGPDAMLRTWDLLGTDSYVSYTMKADRKAYVHADVSPDGRHVAYSWLDDRGTGWVRFVDVVARTATRATPVPLDRDPRWASGAWHPAGGEYVAYCPVMCAGGGRPVWIDPVTGRARRGPTLRGTRALSLAYVDGGRSLLAGLADFTTTVVDAHSLRRRVARMAVAADCCVAPVGDGRTAVAFEFTREDAGRTQWREIDVRSGKVGGRGRVDLLVHTSAVSPDSSTVAVAGDTGEIVTIRLATGEERRSTPLSPVYWLSYSDDGELLVSGAANGGVSLWDATTLDLLGTIYPPHEGDPIPSGAQFIGDTHDVVIASYDGSVYRWETDLERALDFACQMAGRDLTEQEWAQYLPEQPYQSVCPQD